MARIWSPPVCFSGSDRDGDGDVDADGQSGTRMRPVGGSFCVGGSSPNDILFIFIGKCQRGVSSFVRQRQKHKKISEKLSLFWGLC